MINVVLDRLRRAARRRQPSNLSVEKHPDDLPKAGLFTEPTRVASIQVLDPEDVDDGERRVTFLVEVRDADDKRCSQFFVEAAVTGPERSRTVSGTTDLLGRIRFRTTGGAGRYELRITDVGAGGLRWDPDAGTTTATTTLP